MLIPTDRPAYRILAPFFGPDDHLYQEGDCIVFDGTPNEDMEALNEPGKKALDTFFQHLDACGRQAAEKAGRAYTGRPRSLDQAIALAHEDARRVQLISGDGGVPLMGAKKGDSSSIRRLDPAEAPDTGRPNRGKLSLGAR